MNVAINYFRPTETAQKSIEKEKKYKDKQRRRRIENMTPQEATTLKSSVTQSYCCTSLLIECIDTIFELHGMEKHYPIIKDFQNEMIKLNTELYSLAVKNEEDELNRVDFENLVSDIVMEMPKLNIKQLKLLREFANNLKFKK